MGAPAEVLEFLRAVKRATDALQNWERKALHVAAGDRKSKHFTPDGRMVGDIGKVLLRDWRAVEELVDDLHDFGFGVEPFDKCDSFVAVGDAKVEFVADFGWEIRDLRIACFHSWAGPCRHGFVCREKS